jgi:hypothetical protein
MLTELIAAYESRLQSYIFLLERLESEQKFTQDPHFLQFCACETKRLNDLVQLCEQVLSDLNKLQHARTPELLQRMSQKKPEEN